MINILIPMGGKSKFFNSHEYVYPRSLIEIYGKTMIQRIIENYAGFDNKHFIFVTNQVDCETYHIDSILELLTDSNCDIVELSGPTKGAACSALMAIELINNETPLIIANGDQVIEAPLADIEKTFQSERLDAAIISFESIHPKWSYVRTDKFNRVIEAAEKKPLSKKAIAGFYYFRKGKDFVSAAMQSIAKDSHVNDIFYIAPVLNELILSGKQIGYHAIDATLYHSFYSPAKITEYENWLEKYGDQQ
jgi:NDP-sugar pyrophosphorylase family protein